MDVMDRFERLSRLFVARFMNPVWEACGDVEHDGWASLRLFLLGYAFERQGRSADYAPAAAETIDEIRQAPFAAKMAGQAWERFAEKLNNEKLNHQNNPLHSGGGQMSAVELAAALPEPMVTWAKKMVGSGKVRRAHAQLQRIRGIGPKIASFFLRDVAVKYHLAPGEDRDLLQPVDTWVEFVVQRLSGDGTKDRTSCARFIVENATAPERANQGMWYFCVPVAGSSRYLVRRCLEDNDRYEAAVDHHLSRLKTGGAAAQGFNEEKAE